MLSVIKARNVHQRAVNAGERVGIPDGTRAVIEAIKDVSDGTNAGPENVAEARATGNTCKCRE